MLVTNDLKDREFIGKVLPDIDNKRQGRYKVHIPDLMPSIPENKGIWVKNQIHNWRITTSNVGEYGQYFPVQPGTNVIIKFFENDINTGYILRIISDHVEKSNVEAQDCTAEFNDPKDRDEQYILFKTPKKWNIFYVNEETENEPNTIYLIYNRDNKSHNEDGIASTDDDGKPLGRRTVFRIDESGLTFWTRDNNRVRIRLDDNKQVDGNQTEYVKGYRTKHIDSDDDLYIHANQRETIEENRDTYIQGNDTKTIDKNNHLHILENQYTLIDINKEIEIGEEYTVNVGTDYDINVGSAFNLKVGDNAKIEASGNIDVKSGGNAKISASGDVDIKGDGDTSVSASGKVNINGSSETAIFGSTKVSLQSDTIVAIDAPGIALNCGLSSTASSASSASSSSPTSPTSPNDADEAKPKTHVRDLGPSETTEYNFGEQDNDERPHITGNKCDDVTTKFNTESRQTLPE